ncbi:hypothetical protein [Kitasatospora camelliae]|uniref:Secreted protein n=1 Tax=Kitasatospora camelliae TaxID=3156397 RepID=A0AAU8JVF0_9ACTN
METTTIRRAAVLLAGAALAATVLTPGAASAAEPAGTVTSAVEPPADFRDCPQLPAGADPARWRCEVHVAAPRLTLGTVHDLELAPMMLTFAEGPLPDGRPGQVWGALRSAPTAVPGGVTGNPGGDRSAVLGMSIRPEYGGRSDFYTGEFSLRFRLDGPLLPPGCTVGGGRDGGTAPIDLRLKRSGPSERVSVDPPLIRYATYDDTFAAAATDGCGPLGHLLDARLGLPAPTGNLIANQAAYTFRTYDRLG